MHHTVVCSVQLNCTLEPGEQRVFTSANKLPHPKTARIKWSSDRLDEVALEWLSNGAGRDVFSAIGAKYVLKLQQGKWHARSNKKEAQLAATSLPRFLPEIYGTVLTTLENQEVPVLIVERIPRKLLSFCDALVCKKVTADTWFVLLDTIISFVRLIADA